MKRIFIHHDGALGDTLLSLDCINRIREPGVQIHVVGRPDVVQFLKEAGIADEVSSADSRRYSSLYTDEGDEELKSFLAGFDAAFVFTVNNESLVVRNIWSIIPDTRAIATIPPEAGSEHVARFRAKQCGYGGDAVQRKSLLRIREEEKNWAAEFLLQQGCTAGHHIIAVHPGSGGKKKCWPLDNYVELIRRFVKDPRILSIVLTGQAEDAAAVAGQMSCGERVVFVHNASLMQVAALLSLSTFYIGNDSGISHLAGILKCRGVVLFGSTDPRLWKPVGSSLQVLTFDGISQSVIADRIHMRIEELVDNQRGYL